MDHNDHRNIGSRLALFHQQEEAPGMVFWHPRGFALYRAVEDYIRRRMRRAGFQEVRSPQMLARSLWERSGHWEKFAENMFVLEDGHRPFALKPMSCPCHIQIFGKHVRSFRELPLRFCEFGACHRNEPSGALQGLMRGRSFVQDDAHIFCTEAQIVGEVARFAGMLREIYADFGFPNFRVGFSTRPERRVGDDALWDHAEESLRAAAEAAGLDCVVQPGEGAFYGPKLDFILIDGRGRDWQCGTVQLDFVLPERLDAEYVDADNQRRRPVLIHHAVLGSLERFIGMLLEHYEGRLPFWLAPEQVMVASIGAPADGYARALAERLLDLNLRVACDVRPGRLGDKVAAAHAAAIPVLLAVGPKEAAAGSVSWRQADGSAKFMDMEAALAELARLARPGSAGTPGGDG
ncbi:threonine--tRNA ligase [Ferrovibrio sp.]|uniref:threonine--tRNA ligase n=3 Tax=Ferrovibrio sp. TaxID=1917215 RepID=UPI0025BEC09C|nr:threonine--tRNA ligase [Ferrovibrio sp.]MBX3454138.1 threonine--tRNA ligase [Ferrovibrio sp.]